MTGLGKHLLGRSLESREEGGGRGAVKVKREGQEDAKTPLIRNLRNISIKS